jgi:hypothetical protein
MAGYGDRDKLVFRGFAGIDPRRSGLFPGAYVPQELIERGLLLDAKNCRFSQGRAYWHRNQLKLFMPGRVSTAADQSTVSTFSRTSNVVTCTTAAKHGMVAGNGVRISGSGVLALDGTYEIIAAPTDSTFTFTSAGADFVTTPVTSCLARPEWAAFVAPFVNETYDQLLVISNLGRCYFADVGWSDTPAQWTYGYGIFSGDTWYLANNDLTGATYDGSTLVLTDGIPTPPGFAYMNSDLFMCGGVAPGYNYGWPTCFWDGTQLTAVGLRTPLSVPTATADASGAGNLLAEGRYSYQVVHSNWRFDSLPGPIVDVDVEGAAATAYVEPKTATTPPNHLDTLTIDGIVYRFTDLATVQAGGFQQMPYDVICGWSTDAATDVKVTYRVLQATLKNGHTENASGVASIYTPAHPTVTAEWAYATAGATRVTLTARTTGSAGNSIALAESTSDARIHKSGTALSGGVSTCHIDLASIPLGSSVVTRRKIYRAYTSSLAEGDRGTDFQFVATLNDNTTTSYVDNTPQENLGETIAFDHAQPPRGGMLCQHRDRLWMGEIATTSQSYMTGPTIKDPGGAVRLSNVSTIETTVAHGLQLGDEILIYGVDDTTFNGKFRVASIVSTTKFTVANPGSNGTSDGGLVVGDMEFSGLENVLFYSQVAEPWYWPAENRIEVGSSAPILGLASWHDQLVVLKEDSVWLLTGYGESEFRLTQVPGARGLIGKHFAVSPYGILWAGHGGWELFDGQQVREIIRYSEFSAYTYEIQDIGPPVPPQSYLGEIEGPAVTWHSGRFYMMAGSNEYCLCWSPETDTWELRHMPVSRIGLRSWNYGTYHSHIMTVLQWATPATLAMGQEYLTIVDSEYMPNNAPNGHYGDSEGTSTSDFFGNVRIELPPIVAEPGEMVNPLDVWVSGQWTVPQTGGLPDTTNDLHLYVSKGENEAWTDLGVVTQNSRMGIPAGYACPRLRLLLSGVRVQNFALQAVTVEYQRRTARGA